LHARYGGPAQDPVKEPVRQLLDDRAAQEARTLGLALRLAYTLCAGTIELLREFEVTQTGDTVALEVLSESSLSVGETVQRRLEAVARSLGTTAVIIQRDATPVTHA
jgi:exopolyphosphatase/guanosine-5'-triphosphate,3'-diphosphate pyrophosphatase